MINTVRIRTRKPARLFTAIENIEKPSQSAKTESKSGFFNSFFKMWENQANLVVRNLND